MDAQIVWLRAEVDIVALIREIDQYPFRGVPFDNLYPLYLYRKLREQGIMFSAAWSGFCIPTVQDLERTLRPPYRIRWDNLGWKRTLVIEQGHPCSDPQ